MPVARYALSTPESLSGAVALKWTLSGETNTYGYAVERSATMATWQPVGFVASQGLSAQARDYTYQDQTVQGLTQAFYRLRQTNPGGAACYSSVASLQLASSPLATSLATSDADQFSLFPNPTRNRVTLVLPAAVRGDVVVVLTDLSGRRVLTQALRSGATLDVSLPAALPGGVYLLQVQATGFVGRPQRLVIE